MSCAQNYKEKNPDLLSTLTIFPMLVSQRCETSLLSGDTLVLLE
jgi:hypothetical protein